MPQPRAFGRTTAGRTNRSQAIPRLSDGTFAVLGQTEGALPTGASTARSLASTRVLNQTAASTSTAGLSDTEHRAISLNSTAALTARSTAPIEGVAPARVAAHLKAAQARESRESRDQFQLASVRTILSEGSTRVHEVNKIGSTNAIPPAPPLPQIQLKGEEPTPAGHVFFPSTNTNFGDGSGVAGTRGQRWVSKKGVTAFLSEMAMGPGAAEKLAQARAEVSAPGSSVSPRHNRVPSTISEAAMTSVISPLHFKQKVNLVFSNIRPETPSSKVQLPHNNRTVKQNVRPVSKEELQAKAQHEIDLRAVRKTITALGANAGQLNTATWFKGVPEIHGHAAIRPSDLLSMLENHREKLRVPRLTDKQKAMLTSLVFGDAGSADFLTIMARLQPDDDASLKKSGIASETETYLSYWAHLPPPAPKSDPEPTAIAALRSIRNHMDSRGLGQFLLRMGFSTGNVCSKSSFFAQCLPRMNITLPPVEKERLWKLLDPENKGTIEYKRFFNINEIPLHQFQEKHARAKALTSRTAAEESKQQREEAKDASEVDYLDSEVKSFPDFTPRPSGLEDGANAAAVLRRNEVGRLDLSAVVPPLFASVAASSARGYEMKPSAIAASGSATARPGDSDSIYCAPVAARAGFEYSIYSPGVASTRWGRTTYSMHTPLSATGGMGRPLSAATARRVARERERAGVGMPKLQVLPTLPLGARDAALNSGAAISSEKLTGRNAFYASETERWERREDALKRMQQEDKNRKVTKHCLSRAMNAVYMNSDTEFAL
jgi:hypothetical protein